MRADAIEKGQFEQSTDFELPLHIEYTTRVDARWSPQVEFGLL